MKIKTYCEYMQCPVGLDMAAPRFTWVCETDKKGSHQSHYRILVTTSEDSLNKEDDILWDSGTVITNQTLSVPYAGKDLQTAQTYYYQVTVGASDGSEYKSEMGFFTMGIMDKEPWKATWLGGPLMEQPTFWFRKGLEIHRKVKNAMIFVVSPCYYVLYVNGQRCGDAVLNNAWTDCSKTVLYASYPVTDKVLHGANAIGIELGNGWNALVMGEREFGIGEHLFSFQMYINYTDGTSQWIYSEPGEWYFTVAGPIIRNSIYQGEKYDARLELGGWSEPDYIMETSGIKWDETVEFEPMPGAVKAQILEPIKVIKHIAPIEIYEIGDGSYTFDMGQNFAGWARLKAKGERGTEIRMVFAELQHEDHTINQMTLRKVKATDTYIMKGADVEEYEPRFTFHGFRYIQVFGLLEKPKKDTITGCVVHSAVERIGAFNCDNDLINKLYSNIIWTETSNLFGLPTDCPQRDERLGWLNDMTVRNEGAIYNFRLPQLYTKWMQDIRDTQGKVSGAIADTAPFVRFGQRPGDPVDTSFLLIPWNIYCHYHDKKIIEDNYEANKRWVAYLKRNSNNYIQRYSPMGDWAAPINGTNMDSIGAGAVSVITPTYLIATGYFYYNCLLMAKMADVLGKAEDKEYYFNEAEKIKEAFNKKYYNTDKKYYYSNSQGCNTLPLYLDMVPDKDKASILGNLIKDIVETNDTHVTTGNLCTRYIIEVLFNNDMEDLAYDLLTQTTYPSWGYMIENGATTIWERWEHITEECEQSGMASHNHPMYGSVGVCFFKYIAGVNIDENDPGFKNITFKPIAPEKMMHAAASVETLRGLVSCNWKKNVNGKFEMEVNVPFNCTGEVSIPIKDLDSRRVKVTANGVNIYDAGATIKEEYIYYISQVENYLVFKVCSGKYLFERYVV